MKADEYLAKVLKSQTFADNDKELKDLRKWWKEIEGVLKTHFSEAKPSIRWAGSVAKDTMIRESYDGDMTCYFAHEEEEGGTTLKEIYDNTAAALREHYDVVEKASALRVKDRSTTSTNGVAEDLHIDVVPGRYIDENDGDVFLHRTTPEKERLQTNLDTHIDHIKNSKVTDAIRLMKYWRCLNGLQAKTFVLELLVVKLLKGKKSASLSAQLEHVWKEFRDNPTGLSVEDPANSNNDLKPQLDVARWQLSSVATTTLANIEKSGWQSVFGTLKDEPSDDDKRASLKATAAAVVSPSRPWCFGR